MTSFLPSKTNSSASSKQMALERFFIAFEITTTTPSISDCPDEPRATLDVERGVTDTTDTP